MKKKFNIKQFGPCDDAVEWYDTMPSFEEAWQKCHRGDWMLWIAARLKVDNRKLILAKAYCAKTVYHLLESNSSREAIVAAINYGRGLITDNELRIAADAAYAAALPGIAAHAIVHAAANAAYAAVNADYATVNADHVAYAAHAAAYAAHAAAIADDVTDADAAERANQLKTANICRKYLTKEVFKKID